MGVESTCGRRPDDIRVLFVEDDPSVPKTDRIPVVILSNWNEQELVERGAGLGALDHLIKSQTTPARLSTRLKDWLRA